MNTGTNLRMRSASFLGRYGRLLALCGLSLLLHLAVIACLDLRIAAPPPATATPGLAVRLARAPQPAPPAALAPAPAELYPVPEPEPEPEPAPDPVPSAAVEAPAPAEGPSAAPSGEIFQMPSRYRVAMPPAVTLRYEVRDGQGAPGEATLRWETDGVRYRLALDGVLGRIDSEGGTDDAGIAPQRTNYALGAGSAPVAFDRERRRIVFESFGRSAQDTPGSQDGATLLMQLAGIGLADPDQVQEAVDVYVGRADGAAVERFHVVGRERLATPLGGMEALHLVRGGAPRLEIWLAPARGWLPVQLRTTAPDGSVHTQLVKEIIGAP